MPRLTLVLFLAAGLAACEPARQPVAAAASPEPAAPSAQSTLVERLGVAVRSFPGGALVTAIDLDGLAAQSGVQLGDVIVAVNGAAVAGARQLESALGAAAQGALSLEVLREGERRQIALLKTDAEAAWGPLGLQLRELPARTREVLGVPYGLMVMKMRSPANRTQLLPGDVIVGVDEQPIHSLEEFKRLVSGHKAGAVGLLVRRPDIDLYVPVPSGGDASVGSGLPRGPLGILKTRQAKGRLLRT